MYKWIEHVVPSYKEYLLPFKDICDQVIINNTDDPEVIHAATNTISEDLREKLQIF